MYTLKNSLRGTVIDVLYGEKSKRIYLVTDPGEFEHGPHYMLPLLCPACGEPWHFVWNDTLETLVGALKESLAGFELVEVKYYAHSSGAHIADTMEKLSAGSGPAELFLENAADHTGADAIFPVVSLAFELRVPSDWPLPEELRAMSSDEVRDALGLDDKEDIETAIRELEGWIESGDFEDYDVEDDILLIAHPAAILDTLVVHPHVFLDENKVLYPYKSVLREAEDPDADDDDELEDEDLQDGLF